MSKLVFGLIVLFAAMVVVPKSEAHCDSLGGPVIGDARVALKSGDIGPVLKWVRKSDEAELRSVFSKVLAVRGKDKDIQEIAEQFFFETLVRLHRASEGAPYTGLKPEAVAHDPVIEQVDSSLASGDSKALVQATVEHVRRELTEKFERAAANRKATDASVEAGREYVRSYVELVHYVEGLHGGHESEQMSAEVHQHE